jgi:hypothetical protein
MDDARSFEKFFLGGRHRVSDQEGIAGLCRAKVEVWVQAEAVFVRGG